MISLKRSHFEFQAVDRYTQWTDNTQTKHICKYEDNEILD